MATLPNISPHLHIKEGFCYPDWDAIYRCIEEALPESEWNEAWEIVSRMWIDRNRDKLGGNYQVLESENFMVLSEAPERVIQDACRSFEDALKRVLESLAGIASDEASWKRPVLMFASIDDYYQYIAHFYPEGEYPITGGVCLSGEGYVHFAFPTTDYSSYRTVLVHELTHGCLIHLPIPIWLNEALAMRMEQEICNSDIFRLDQEIYDKHIAYWNAETIQLFWTGESWHLPGEGFSLSSNLAQVIWRKVEVDLSASRAEILQFVSEAHANTSGEAAFQKIFDTSLGELASDFLGEGDWAPCPTEWPDTVLKDAEKNSDGYSAPRTDWMQTPFFGRPWCFHSILLSADRPVDTRPNFWFHPESDLSFPDP